MENCARPEGRRITGSARQTLDVLCVVRKLMKWEEVQEEGGWIYVGSFLELLTRKFIVKRLTRNSKGI